jgi:hypothetical protein
VRKRLLQHRSAIVPKANATLDDLMRDARDHWENVGHPTGTIRQYRSDWNAHVPDKIGAVTCHEVGIAHYSAIFNQLNEERTSEQVIDAVARTLGAVVTFGVLNGYFPDGQPFGGPDLRRATVKEARATAARQNRARKKKRIHLDECPTAADVDKYAAAFEEGVPRLRCPPGLSGLRDGPAHQRGARAAVGLDQPGHARRGRRLAARPLRDLAGPCPAEGQQAAYHAAVGLLLRRRG